MKLKMFNKKLEYHVENVKALKNIKTIKFYENFNRNSNVSHKNASNISKHYIFLKKNVKIDQKGWGKTVEEP